MPLPEIRANLEPPSDAQILCMRAQQDLEFITALRRIPAFEHYLRRRISEKITPLREAILTKQLSLDEYRATQAKMFALLEVLGMVDDDEAANRSILAD